MYKSMSKFMLYRCTMVCSIPFQKLAEAIQVDFEAGDKRLVLQMANVTDLPTIPGELFAKFQTRFYADPRDAVFKALEVE